MHVTQEVGVLRGLQHPLKDILKTIRQTLYFPTGIYMCSALLSAVGKRFVFVFYALICVTHPRFQQKKGKSGTALAHVNTLRYFREFRVSV